MEKLILAIDQGTTSSRAIIFNQDSQIIASSQMEIPLICPKSGWVEQSATLIWETVYEVVKEVLLNPKVDETLIKSIGITNQRETTIVWNKETKLPIYNAIVWQSRQSQDICDKLIEDGLLDMVKEKTGLIINPYFSATKIRWILDNVNGAKELAHEKKLLFGTVDSYLVWLLTEGKLHITDYSNASRTMLFNIHTLSWDKELLDILGIDESMLPQVVNSSENYGIATKLKSIDPNLNISICSIIGDQQASLFGQCCFNLGDVKSTYGTGCFMLMNTKKNIVKSQNGLLTTIAWGINGDVEYALEGSVFIAGSVVQWLRDGMQLITKSSDVDTYSDINEIPSSNGIYIVPAFVGLGTPYWDNDARGAVFGLTRATKKRDFINAAVESIAYQAKDVMEVMKEDAEVKISVIGVDGGASINNYLIQFQSDLLDCKIVRPECLETTALGAAYLAGLASNVWKNKDELKRLRKINQIFLPTMEEQKREKLYSGWKKAVNATRLFK